MDVKVIEQKIKDEGNEKFFEYEGFPCAIIRIPQMGHLCGYVEVTQMKDSATIEEIMDLEVHGCITFHGDLEHLGLKGYWVGFDCAHFQDIIPFIHLPILDKLNYEMVYRDMEFVEIQLMFLVDQMRFLRRKNDTGLRNN